MNPNLLITAAQSNFQTIKLKLNATATSLYTYKAPIEMSLEVGDTVIVAKESSADGWTGYRAVLVEAVDKVPDIDYTSELSYKWIVGKVEPEAYLEQVAAEKEIAQTLAKMEVHAVRRQIIAQAEQDSPEMLEYLQNAVNPPETPAGEK